VKLLRAIDVHLVDVKEVVRTCRKTGISEILSNLKMRWDVIRLLALMRVLLIHKARLLFNLNFKKCLVTVEVLQHHLCNMLSH